MKPIPLPHLSERIIGVTLPKDGKFLVCDYDEILEVAICDPPQVQPVEGDPETVEQRTDFIGRWRDNSIHRVGENRITFNFKSTARTVKVKYDCSGRRGLIEFRTLSGDWFYASFSEDGRYLILAEPYAVELYAVLE